MSLKRKEILMRQKASVEHELKVRLTYLAGKGLKPPKTDKDPIVRKLKADIRAANRRLGAIAANDKRTEEAARIKAERAAAPRKGKEQEGAKAEKPKKGHEEGKAKKPKAEPKGEPKAAPPAAHEDGKS